MQLQPFSRSINTIHCDQDGVLVDFDRFVFEGIGYTFDQNRERTVDDSPMWNYLHSVPTAYQLMHLTPYAKRLWAAIVALNTKRQILTAIPRRTSMPLAEEHKREHAKLHLDPNVTVVIGPHAADKWKHCLPGDILIDDRISNCDDWEKKGNGIAIFHDGDVEKTIRLLHLHVLTEGVP